MNHCGDFLGGEASYPWAGNTPCKRILRVTRPNGECCPNLVSNTSIFIYIIGSNAVSIVLKMTLDQVSDMFLVLSN